MADDLATYFVLSFPPGGVSFTMSNGEVYYPDEQGHVRVPMHFANQMLKRGFGVVFAPEGFFDGNNYFHYVGVPYEGVRVVNLGPDLPLMADAEPEPPAAAGAESPYTEGSDPNSASLGHLVLPVAVDAPPDAPIGETAPAAPETTPETNDALAVAGDAPSGASEPSESGVAAAPQTETDAAAGDVAETENVPLAPENETATEPAEPPGGDVPEK